MSLTISINGIKFTLLRKTNYYDRYKELVNVLSIIVEDDDK
jgi:hypothetical protein